MDIIQSGSAMRQTLIHAAKNSPRPATDNESVSNQEQSKNRLVTARAVRAEDIPQTARHDEKLPSHVGHVHTTLLHYRMGVAEERMNDSGTTYIHYRPGEIEQRRSDSFQAELDSSLSRGLMHESSKGFQAEAEAMFPEINTRDFGLSVDAEGELMILNKRGKLTETQHTQLTSLLNNSSHYSTLKHHANNAMEASIRWAEAANGTETMDSLHKSGDNLIINKQNFHQIFDFFSNTSTMNQLYSAPKEAHTHTISIHRAGQWVDIRV